ncbi:MAG: hypothetical protein LC640_03105 [Frankia sp.]|nr:hypothetical protein [Frankia sp.]
MADYEKSRKNLKLTLDVDDNLTYGELAVFLDYARRAGVSANDSIAHELNDDDQFSGFYIYVDRHQFLGGGGSGGGNGDQIAEVSFGE